MDDVGLRRSSRPRQSTLAPPQPACAANRGKKDLPPEAAQVLKDWMLNHFHNPYPTPTVRVASAHIDRMSPHESIVDTFWCARFLTHCIFTPRPSLRAPMPLCFPRHLLIA